MSDDTRVAVIRDQLIKKGKKRYEHAERRGKSTNDALLEAIAEMLASVSMGKQ